MATMGISLDLLQALVTVFPVLDWLSCMCVHRLECYNFSVLHLNVVLDQISIWFYHKSAQIFCQTNWWPFDLELYISGFIDKENLPMGPITIFYDLHAVVHQDSIGIEMLKLGFTGVPKTICSKFWKASWSSYVVMPLVSHKLDLNALAKALMPGGCHDLFTFRRRNLYLSYMWSSYKVYKLHTKSYLSYKLELSLCGLEKEFMFFLSVDCSTNYKWYVYCGLDERLSWYDIWSLSCVACE